MPSLDCIHPAFATLVRRTMGPPAGAPSTHSMLWFPSPAAISRMRSTSDGARGGVCGSGFFGWGGSVYFSNSGTSTRPAPILSISQSTIRTSKGCRGGAVAYNSGSSAQLVIRNSTIEENVAPIMGGGLYLRGPGSVFLSGNTIAQNTAANGDADPGAAIAKVGGGIAFDGFTGPLTMKGNIIAKNKATAPELANGTPAPGALDCQIVGTFSSNRTSSFDLLGMQGNCAFVPLGPLVGTDLRAGRSPVGDSVDRAHGLAGRLGDVQRASAGQPRNHRERRHLRAERPAWSGPECDRLRPRLVSNGVFARPLQGWQQPGSGLRSLCGIHLQRRLVLLHQPLGPDLRERGLLRLRPVVPAVMSTLD